MCLRLSYYNRLGKNIFWQLLVVGFSIFSVQAATVPYPRELTGQLEQDAIAIVESKRTGSIDALTFARLFHAKTSNSSVSIRGWATMFCSELLLFNDSISKAQD